MGKLLVARSELGGPVDLGGMLGHLRKWILTIYNDWIWGFGVGMGGRVYLRDRDQHSRFVAPAGSGLKPSRHPLVHTCGSIVLR